MRNITKFLMLVVLCLVGMQGNAQNVTVHPGNGSMLPALKSGNSDTFFRWGGFATWKHEQLSLTMTTGDSDNNDGTDADGQLARPANDIFASADGKYLQIGKGGINNSAFDTYLTIALPKGYRFTGYTIKFHRIARPNGSPTDVNNYTGDITFGETDNTFAYTSTINSTNDNITTYRGGIGQSNTTVYTIGRTSQTDTDMDNVLYFKLGPNVASRAFIQLDHVELLFTAENNYAPLIPAPNVVNQSAVDIPFTTSKMDYGTLEERTDRGPNGNSTAVTRISYNGTIHDMNANLTLYENGSTETITAEQNDFDGTAGDIVKYQSGSISQAGDYFKLKASDHGQYNASAPGAGALSNGEVIYYIESPIWAVNSAAANANKNPIGYRIIGADFDYTGGNLKFPAVFKIQYESTGHSADQNGTYGLNLYNGAIAYNWNYQTEWRIDDDGYIYNGQYYLQTGNTNTSTTLSVTTTKPSASRGTFEIVTNNGVKQIRRKSNTSYYIGWNETTYNGNITRTAVMTNNTNRRATYNELSHAFSENIGQYTFNIYDKTGTRVEKTVTVNGTSGTLSIDGLNNDAVKIGVIGTGIIKGHITLQALDPYIDHIDIVCQEKGTNNGGKLTQQFTATDFSVRGGKFTFYVPEDFTFPAQFTFENLYSKYGDETYYNTPSTNHGRYFFMGSPYGETNDNVYNRSESASYTTKIICEKPGDKKFTFNNASTASTTTGSQFEEYPFSKALYASKVNGSFDDFEFSTTEMANGTTKTAYLFTCDETRYNIAPTTATQHVYYAYYEMTIDMKKKDYRPNLEWTKVYDETFYGDNKTDAMWGLKVSTTETVDDQGTHSGYVTVSQLLDVIENGLPAVPAQGTEAAKPAVQGLDNTGTKAPKSMNQILYIDGSDLMNIVENQKNNISHKVSELKTGLATNALIYLPYGSTNSDDNFAFNTIPQYGETPFFRGASNIVLTDKNPFFAKYDIQVDAAKYAKYSRQISQNINGKVSNATLILPFALEVTEGVHTNATADGCKFSLNTMNANQTFAQNDPSYEFNVPTAAFSAIEGESSVANTPYFVHVETPASDDNISFIATQSGATIAKTPTQSGSTLGQQFYTGETAHATFTYKENPSGESYDFTAEGNYSGTQYVRTASEDVFYFAHDMFLNLHTLRADIPSLTVYPFRSVYTYKKSGTGVGVLNFFEVTFDDELGDTDAIVEMPKRVDLAVRSGKGYLSMTSAIDQTVNVRSLNGMSVGELNMRAGDSQSINLPAGIYLVNNVKIIVK